MVWMSPSIATDSHLCPPHTEASCEDRGHSSPRERRQLHLAVPQPAGECGRQVSPSVDSPEDLIQPNTNLITIQDLDRHDCGIDEVQYENADRWIQGDVLVLRPPTTLRSLCGIEGRTRVVAASAAIDHTQG